MDLDEARERLLEQRAQLRALSNMAAGSREVVRLDQQSVGRLSRMDAMQQQAMAQANERQRATQLQRIDAALARIENGEFGRCENCGEKIPEKRLEIDPAALMCVPCAGGGRR